MLEQFRRAFAAGWAASGGPMTDRVRKASVVAVELAAENADDPRVLENTLNLGSLEGTWALLYERREKFYEHHIGDITTQWRLAVRDLPFEEMVDRFRRSIGVTEAEDTDKASVMAKAKYAAMWLLGKITDNSADEDYVALTESYADAIKTGHAEGDAGAVALATQKEHVVGIDFDAAHAAALAGLAAVTTYGSDAKAWIGRTIRGAASDIARVLTNAAGRGASARGMADEARDLMDADEVAAVGAFADMALGRAFTDGMLARYARWGVRQVDWVTAGAGNVCPVCLGYESANPWSLIEAPRPPEHPHCKCVLIATGSLRDADLSSYLPGAKT